MGIKDFFAKLFYNNVYYDKWTCCSCGCEIFNDKYFCDDCIKELKFNDKCICAHCGRQTLSPEEYCLTCKETLLSIDRARSVFCYEGRVKSLVKRMKHPNNAYLTDVFSWYLSGLYFRNLFACDFVSFVPMTKKRFSKRGGYNHGKVLAEKFAKHVNLSVLDVLIKSKETKKQALLSRKDRMKNVKGSFKVKDKKLVKDKRIVLIDDVTTTGATAEEIASVLKKAGAKEVILLTVASVKSKNCI